jgi:hypothetical protein
MERGLFKFVANINYNALINYLRCKAGALRLTRRSEDATPSGALAIILCTVKIVRYKAWQERSALANPERIASW